MKTNIYKVTMRLQDGNCVTGYIAKESIWGPDGIPLELLGSDVYLFTIHDLSGRLYAVKTSSGLFSYTIYTSNPSVGGSGRGDYQRVCTK